MSSIDENGHASTEVGAPQDSQVLADEAPPPCEAQPPKWFCPKCDEPNKAQRDRCNNCDAPKPGSVPVEPARPQQPAGDAVDQALEELLKSAEPAKPAPNVKNEKKEERWTCPKCDEINKPERDRCNSCGWVKRSNSVMSIGSDSPEKPPPAARVAPAESVKPANSNVKPAESKRSKSSSSSSTTSRSSSSSSSSSSSDEAWAKKRRSPARKRRSASRKRRSPSRRRRSPSRRGDKGRPGRRGSRSRSKSFRRPAKTVEDHPMFRRQEHERERKERQMKFDEFVRNEEKEREAAREHQKDDYREQHRKWDGNNDSSWDSKEERSKDDWRDRDQNSWKDTSWKDDRHGGKNDRESCDWKSRDWKQDRDSNDWKAKSWKDKEWHGEKDDWKKSSWKDKDGSWKDGAAEPPIMVPPSMPLQPDGPPPSHLLGDPVTPVSGIGGTPQDTGDADWKGGSRSWGEKTDGSTWDEGDYKRRSWHKSDDSKQAWSNKRSWGEEDAAWNEKEWKKAKKDRKDNDKKRGKEEKKEKKEKKKKQKDMPDKIDGVNWEEPRENVSLKVIKELADGNGLKWEYPLWDDSRRSYAGYLRSPFSDEENAQYFDTIREGTNWLQPTSAYGVMPRKTAWLVKPGCTCNYHYGPFEVDACEYPNWMIDLMTEVMPKCGLNEPDEWPDSCNMNLYEDGGSAVGWHADDESLFQGKFQDIAIISVSFGATRKFELRYNWPEESDAAVIRIPINSGDLMTMEGMCQKHLQHRVPKEEYVSSPRINLTWRWVRKHTPRCGACRTR